MLSKFLFSLPSNIVPDELRFDSSKPDSIYRIARSLDVLYNQLNSVHKPIIILCIGTDRSTGDSLGPLVGSKLKKMCSYPHILGTLDDPVHATNLNSVLTTIAADFNDSFIIAVDACLGRTESIGFISIGQGSLKPGAAVNKTLPAVGDVYITGTVNVGGFMEHMVLQSTRLSIVMKMADSLSLAMAFWLHSIQPANP